MDRRNTTDRGGRGAREVTHGTRVTIELEAKYQRGRGSVDEYLEQTAIANPHVTMHYNDPEDNRVTYRRSTTDLPPEPKEIKPHPYGVELGRLVTMLKDTKAPTLAQFLDRVLLARQPGGGAADLRGGRSQYAGLDAARSAATRPTRSTRPSRRRRSRPPATDCITPIGEELMLKGLHQVVPGEFYCAATRPPAVYRGNPFQIEVALAYGGAKPVQKVPLELLPQLLDESDARTLRQFLINTFDGLGRRRADKILKEAEFGTRQSPGKLSREDIEKLHEAMRNVNCPKARRCRCCGTPTACRCSSSSAPAPSPRR